MAIKPCPVCGNEKGLWVWALQGCNVYLDAGEGTIRVTPEDRDGLGLPDRIYPVVGGCNKCGATIDPSFLFSSDVRRGGPPKLGQDEEGYYVEEEYYDYPFKKVISKMYFDETTMIGKNLCSFLQVANAKAVEELPEMLCSKHAWLQRFAKMKLEELA